MSAMSAPDLYYDLNSPVFDHSDASLPFAGPPLVSASHPHLDHLAPGSNVGRNGSLGLMTSARVRLVRDVSSSTHAHVEATLRA